MSFGVQAYAGGNEMEWGSLVLHQVFEACPQLFRCEMAGGSDLSDNLRVLEVVTT